MSEIYIYGSPIMRPTVTAAAAVKNRPYNMYDASLYLGTYLFLSLAQIINYLTAISPLWPRHTCHSFSSSPVKVFFFPAAVTPLQPSTISIVASWQCKGTRSNLVWVQVHHRVSEREREKRGTRHELSCAAGERSRADIYRSYI